MENNDLCKKTNCWNKGVGVLYIALFVVSTIDLFIAPHPYFPWEEFPLFYGLFALISALFLTFGAKFLIRKLVMRKEDYYE